MTSGSSLQELWDAHNGRLIDKWAHYLPIYERYFAKFRGTAVRLLEIGVCHGGSLQLWKAYFGPKATIMGLDIDPRCSEYMEDQISIFTGNQTDQRQLAAFQSLDIVIDDGSHKFEDQQASLNGLYPNLNVGGVYLIEDIHDQKVAMTLQAPTDPWSWAYYPWVSVWEKLGCKPQRIVTGHPSRPLNADEVAAYSAIDPQYEFSHVEIAQQYTITESDYIEIDGRLVKRLP
jgi:hypothetical protein